MFEFNTDYKRIVKNIRKNFEIYLRKYKLQSVVLGVSGGIDSALVAALAKPVCKKLEVNLIGVSIPIKTNKIEEITRARDIMNMYCDIPIERNLGSIYDSNIEWLAEGMSENKIADGNIKARIRMIQLYHLAGLNHGMVMSTDNLTELYLGFWTLNGDVGDYGMIQQLWKTEVYGVAEYLVKNEHDKGSLSLKACIDAIPTDGLGISNSDLDQLGASTYAEVDKILYSYIYEGSKKYRSHPVVKRYLSSMYKRNNPYNITREELLR